MSKNRLAPNQGADFYWGLGAPKIKAAGGGGLFYSRTSYSKATPSGSFSANHVFRSILIGEDFDVLGIANLLAGVDVDKDGHDSVRRNGHGHIHQNGACSRTQDKAGYSNEKVGLHGS